MRHSFGLKMLEVLAAGKRIWNVDETYFNSTNFRRRGWSMKNDKLTLVSKPVVPRLAVIAAVNQFGRMVASVCNHDTNSIIFGNFLHHLAEILSKEDPNFRKHSVILIDNAAYHSSCSSLEMLSRYNIPILFLGSYSYLMAPIELYWGLFKNADLNPDGVPTTKSKFIFCSNAFQNFLQI